MLPCNNQESPLGTHNVVHFVRARPQERAGMPTVVMQASTDLVFLGGLVQYRTDPSRIILQSPPAPKTIQGRLQRHKRGVCFMTGRKPCTTQTLHDAGVLLKV